MVRIIFIRLGLPMAVGFSPRISTRFWPLPEAIQVGSASILLGLPVRAYKQSDDSVFASRPDQFSVALETSWPKLFRLPIDVSLGLYGDVGQLYQNSFGLTLKFSYAGSYRF